MRTASKILLAATLAGAALVAAPASARTFVSIGIGGPIYPRAYGYRPAYYPGYYSAYYGAPAYAYGAPAYAGWYGPHHYWGRPWRGYYRPGYYGHRWR